MTSVMQIIIVAAIVCRLCTLSSISIAGDGGSPESKRVTRTVVKAEWIIRSLQDKQIPVRTVIGMAAFDHRAWPHCQTSPPMRRQSMPQGLFRGIVDDLPRRTIGESTVYSMLMPMGALAMTYLDNAELEALVALGLQRS